jgi:hypothetical protein
MRMACHDCKVDTNGGSGIDHYYSLHDEIWQQAKRGRRMARMRFLCLDCLERRLGRPLRSTDFALTPGELMERMATGGEHTVLPERERQRGLDYWRERHRKPE